MKIINFKVSDDWRDSSTSISLRAQYLLDTGHLTDCTFQLDSKEISGHKLILAMGSPVFQAMFYGSLVSTDTVIPILDIEYDVFCQFIHFLYTDQLIATSAKNACDIYSAAKKYIVTPLVKECLKYIQQHVDSKNVLSLYEFAVFHGEESLKHFCKAEIQQNTKEILSSEFFSQANVETMSAILDFNCLNIESEAELVSAVVRWSESERIRRDLKTVNDMGDILSSVLQKLRLLTLTSNEFIDILGESQLLSDKEKLYVLTRLVKPALPVLPLEYPNVSDQKIKRRVYLSTSFIKLELRDIRQSRCDGSEWLTSTFCISSRITILGVELSLQVPPGYQRYSNIVGKYTEYIMVKIGKDHSQNYFATGSFSGLAAYNNKIQIMFSPKADLEPNENYSIHTFLCKPGSYPIGKFASNHFSVPGHPDILFISHSSWESCHPPNTTVLTGIIYKDLIL